MKTVVRARREVTHAVREEVGYPDPRSILTGDVVVHDEATGDPVIAQVLLPDDGDGWRVLAGAPFKRHQRTQGLRYSYATFGGNPRKALWKRDYCMHAEMPAETYAYLAGLDSAARAVYREVIPQAEPQQLPLIGQVLPEWRVTPESWWTSGVINDTKALTYHRDANNFAGSWSAMAVYRDGVRGGMLAIPEYRVTLSCPHRALVLFQGVELIHGVSRLRYDRPDARRLSVVFYAVRNMRHCLPCDEEFATGRRRRTEREENPT